MRISVVRDEWGYHPIADGREEMRAAVAALPRESGNGKGPNVTFWTYCGLMIAVTRCKAAA